MLIREHVVVGYVLLGSGSGCLALRRKEEITHKIGRG